jgi:hypothetical protein
MKAKPLLPISTIPPGTSAISYPGFVIQFIQRD